MIMYRRIPPFHRNRLGRTLLVTGPAADAPVVMKPHPGPQPGFQSASHGPYLPHEMRIDVIRHAKILLHKSFRILSRLLYLCRGNLSQTALIRLLQRRHLFPLQPNEVRGQKVQIKGIL